MSKPPEIKSTITASGREITVLSAIDREDYISLTDIARYKNPEFPGYVIQNWLRLRSTVEFIGLWEHLNNPLFNYLEFEAIKKDAGTNSFVLTPKKWIESTSAIGMTSKAGRYAATFAHSDIAFEFASWISPEFKLYVIRDYQRLKSEGRIGLALDWSVKRILSKANYKIHTDAIKANLILPSLTPHQRGHVYADEADLLNVALFGKTAAQWRKQNPKATGNIRDSASIEQLLVLTNLENINALLIQQGVTQEGRLTELRRLAISQLATLSSSRSAQKLSEMQTQTHLQLPDSNHNAK